MRYVDDHDCRFQSADTSDAKLRFVGPLASKLGFSAEKQTCPVLIRPIPRFMRLVQTGQHRFVLRDHAAQKKPSYVKAEACK